MSGDWVAIAMAVAKEGIKALVPGAGIADAFVTAAVGQQEGKITAWLDAKKETKAYEHQLRVWASGRGIGEADLEIGLEQAKLTLAQWGAAAPDIVRLGLDPDRVADEVLERDRARLGEMSESSRLASEEAVKVFYRRLIDNRPGEIRQLDLEINRVLLERTATLDGLNQMVAELPDRVATRMRTLAIQAHAEHTQGIARERAARLMPAGGLQQREEELARLTAFALSPDPRSELPPWLWVNGDAFSGKTALLASFTRQPPAGVHVASAFIRRTEGRTDAGYVLNELFDQLSAIAGEPHGDRRDHLEIEFGRALQQATASLPTRERLIILVDGLDEYSDAALRIDQWLPTALPERTRVILSARTSAHVRLSDTHPAQNGLTLDLTQTPYTSELKKLAEDEITRVVLSDDPQQWSINVLGFLAAAQVGLSADELAQLVGRTAGRMVSAAHLEATLDRSLRNTLVRGVDEGGSEGPAVLEFAHETLLEEARKKFPNIGPNYERPIDEWVSEWASRDPAWTDDLYDTVPPFMGSRLLRSLAARGRKAPERRRSLLRDQVDTIVGDARWIRHAVTTEAPRDVQLALSAASVGCASRMAHDLAGVLRLAGDSLRDDPEQIAGQLRGLLGSAQRWVDTTHEAEGLARTPRLRPDPGALARVSAWDATLQVADLPAEQGKPRCASLGWVGERLVAAIGYDRNVAIVDLGPRVDGTFDFATANAATVLPHPSNVTAVALGSMNGEPVVASVTYQEVSLWGTPGEAPPALRWRRELDGPEATARTELGGRYLTSVALGTHGDRHAIAVVHNERLSLRDSESGEEISAPGWLPAHADHVRGIASVHGELGVLLWADSALAPRRLADGEPQGPSVSLPGEPRFAWASTAGQGWAAAAETWTTVEFADANGPLPGLPGADEMVRDVALLCVDAHYLAVAVPEEPGPTLRLQELRDVDQTLPVPPRDAVAVAAGPDDQYLYLLGNPLRVTTHDQHDHDTTESDLERFFPPGSAPAGFRSGETAALAARARSGEAWEMSRTNDWDWPTTAVSYGRRGGDALLARGSLAGAVWVHNLSSGEVVAGPFEPLDDVTLDPGLAVKMQPWQVRSVSLGWDAADAFVAAAYGGHAWVARLGAAEARRFAPEPGVDIVALANTAAGTQLVTTTSRRIAVWEIDDLSVISWLGLSEPIDRLWHVAGTRMLLCRTESQRAFQVEMLL